MSAVEEHHSTDTKVHGNWHDSGGVVVASINVVVLSGGEHSSATQVHEEGHAQELGKQGTSELLGVATISSHSTHDEYNLT
jgi:hypothetical protein